MSLFPNMAIKQTNYSILIFKCECFSLVVVVVIIVTLCDSMSHFEEARVIIKKLSLIQTNKQDLTHVEQRTVAYLYRVKPESDLHVEVKA